MVLGALSYGLVEKRFMHRSRRRVRVPIARRRARTLAILATVGIGAILLASVPATDPIAHSLQVGQRVLASQATPAAANTTTNSSGNYTFAGLGNGTYTVTPSNSGYSFIPANQSVTINAANKTGANFTARVESNFGMTMFPSSSAKVRLTR